MNRIALLSVLFLIPTLVEGRVALAQSNVIESEPVTLYVNGQSGSNINDASIERPLQTIQAAIQLAAANNAAGLGVKIVLAPGTYREVVTVGPSQTSAPTTVEAATTGTVTIDGADVLTNGFAAGNGIYTYSWQDTVGGCPLPANWYTGMPPVVLANEMIFVNGAMLTQVMNPGQLIAGTFYVNQSYGQVQVDPPPGTDIGTATVEVAARRSTLTVNGGSNLVFRGLILQHAASCMNTTGATVNSASNVLFDSDEAVWNNWSGLGFNSSTGVTVQNTIASYNGGAGLAGFKDTGALWQNNETDYNNWRGAMVGLYDFAQGGIKLMHAHNATVSGHSSYNNPSQGLWFDTDNIDVTITGANLMGNLVGNMQLELSQGPITVTNSNFCSGSGVQILETDGLTMTYNNFYNNGGTTFQNGQLFIAGKPGGRVVTNWQTGQTQNLVSNNMTLSNNAFAALGASEFLFNTYLSGSDWSEFISTLASDNNGWYSDTKPAAFEVAGGKQLTLSGWQNLTGLDKDSEWGLWSGAAQNCSMPTPAFPDFQLLARNAASYVALYSMSKGTLSIPVLLRSFNYGAVNLSVSGLPANVSAYFSVPSLVGGSSVLTLYASNAAQAETVPITIIGTSGGRVHTITVNVAIEPAA